MRALTAFGLWIGVAGLLLADDPKVPVLKMQDQFAKQHDVASLRGDVVVLVFADRGGAEAARDLGKKLHIHFHPTAEGQPTTKAMEAPAKGIEGVPADIELPDAKIVPIAVIGEVPAALHLMVRTRFRQVAPDGAIWLDMTDAMRKQFDVKKDMPNLAVLDVEGRLRGTGHGQLKDDQFVELTRAIDALRWEGAQAKLAVERSAVRR